MRQHSRYLFTAIEFSFTLNMEFCVLCCVFTYSFCLQLHFYQIHILKKSFYLYFAARFIDLQLIGLQRWSFFIKMSFN